MSITHNTSLEDHDEIHYDPNADDNLFDSEAESKIDEIWRDLTTTIPLNSKHILEFQTRVAQLQDKGWFKKSNPRLDAFNSLLSILQEIASYGSQKQIERIQSSMHRAWRRAWMKDVRAEGVNVSQHSIDRALDKAKRALIKASEESFVAVESPGDLPGQDSALASVEKDQNSENSASSNGANNNEPQELLSSGNNEAKEEEKLTALEQASPASIEEDQHNKDFVSNNGESASLSSNNSDVVREGEKLQINGNNKSEVVNISADVIRAQTSAHSNNQVNQEAPTQTFGGYLSEALSIVANVSRAFSRMFSFIVPGASIVAMAEPLASTAETPRPSSYAMLGQSMPPVSGNNIEDDWVMVDAPPMLEKPSVRSNVHDEHVKASNNAPRASTTPTLTPF